MHTGVAWKGIIVDLMYIIISVSVIRSINTQWSIFTTRTDMAIADSRRIIIILTLVTKSLLGRRIGENIRVLTCYFRWKPESLLGVRAGKDGGVCTCHFQWKTIYIIQVWVNHRIRWNAIRKVFVVRLFTYSEKNMGREVTGD